MKKLLVTAIGAAVAFGAFAGEISRQAIGDFGSTGPVTTNELNQTLGNYWSELPGSTNTYTVSTLSSVGEIDTPISPISGKSLDIKTTFGKPLSVNIVSGGSTNIPNTGIYFDSLVKFTVCEDTPTEAYDGAKIIMWLQEAYNNNGDVTGTNLWVRAGYLTTPGNVVATNYMCTTTIDGAFADTWHRITIKAMADMTVGGGLGHIAVPGFAIFIDSTRTLISDDPKWAWADGAYPLTEAAGHYGEAALFPSMVQDANTDGKGTLTCASFDGTGSLTDIVFSDDAPIEIAEDWVEPKATVEINGVSQLGIKTLADAIAAANGAAASANVEIKLAMGFELDAPVEIAPVNSGVTVVLDFNGFVLTNELAGAAITNSANLVVTNSVGKGGIVGKAIYEAASASLAIAGGNFWGDIEAADLAGETITISGGAFAQQGLDLDELGVIIADGKVISDTQNADGLYEVTAPTYTVTFISGIDGQITNSYDNLGDGAEMPTPPDASIAGKNYKWVPALDTVVTSNATYTAVYTDINYTIKFVYGLNQEETNTIVTTYYQTVSEPVGTARPGYTLTWTPAIQDWPITVTHDQTYVATYTGKEFTIVTYTNGVFNTSKVFTYAGASVDPADPLYNSTTEEWDGKWYTTDGGSTEFAFDAAGDLTQNAYATITTKGGGGSDWDVDPSAGTGKTAAQEYPALAGTSLAAADAPKLTTWAKANGVTIAQVAEAAAGSTTYDAYLLNCAPTAEAVAAAKAAFAIPAITVSGTTVSITAPAGTYNGNLQMKGSNNLSTWTDIDSTTGYQFFKYELVP